MVTVVQANEQRLSTLEKIATASGYTRRSFVSWRLRFESFPKPVAVLINKPYRRQRLYDIREFVQWIDEKQLSGEIRNPARKMTTDPRH